MKVLLLFVPVLILACVVAVGLYARTIRQSLPITAAEAHRHAQLMARQLDLGLNDPMLRQSTEWEDRTRVLLENYYGASAPERKYLP